MPVTRRRSSSEETTATCSAMATRSMASPSGAPPAVISSDRSLVANPGLDTERRYRPGLRCSSMYLPSASDVVVHRRCGSCCAVRVTSAPATASPTSFLTVPRSARTSCADTTPQTAKTNSVISRARLRMAVIRGDRVVRSHEVLEPVPGAPCREGPLSAAACAGARRIISSSTIKKSGLMRCGPCRGSRKRHEGQRLREPIGRALTCAHTKRIRNCAGDGARDVAAGTLAGR